MEVAFDYVGKEHRAGGIAAIRAQGGPCAARLLVDRWPVVWLSNLDHVQIKLFDLKRCAINGAVIAYSEVELVGRGVKSARAQIKNVSPSTAQR